MLRLILSRYLQQEASQLDFCYNPQGKPALKEAQKLEFNLSHSEDLAVLAVGRDYPLGVDVEFFSARPYEGIAETLFSPAELDRFLKLDNSLKPQVFFHIWAQKEAFIKACGLGLSYPTKSFDVPIFSPTSATVADSVFHKKWFMRSFMPSVACSAALCHHPEVTEIRQITVNNCADFFA